MLLQHLYQQNTEIMHSYLKSLFSFAHYFKKHIKIKEKRKVFKIIDNNTISKAERKNIISILQCSIY